jgi:hypothetical protein
MNTYTVIIRKPDTKCIPIYMILTYPENPPDLSVKQIRLYYNDTFEISLNINEYNFDDISNTITKIYNHINNNTSYSVNYGDIIEFPNEVFYFFYLNPILIV